MRIRQLRQELGLTQEELGKKIGQTKSNISKYETGALEPGIDTLKMLSEIFGVTLDYLLEKDNNRSLEGSDSISLVKQKDFEFNNPEEALRFILGQSAMMDYGGYNLKDMSEEEILEIENLPIHDLAQYLADRDVEKRELVLRHHDNITQLRLLEVIKNEK